MVLFPSALPGQFLLEESRLLEAAEMAKTAAHLDSGEFDVVFNAAHMLRYVFDWHDFFSLSSGLMISLVQEHA